MNKGIELVRLKHGKTPGHDLVIKRMTPTSFMVATVFRENGGDRLLHSLHLERREVFGLIKGLLDAMGSDRA